MCASIQGHGETEMKGKDEGIDGDGDTLEGKRINQEKNGNFRRSLRNIFKWKNYRIYVITYCLFAAFSVLNSFLNLYLRDIGWSFVALGVVMSITSIVAVVARFLGGYIGDIVNRKKLAVVAALMFSAHYLCLGLSTEFIIIFSSLMIYAVTDLAKAGSTAYIMDNIPEDDSGLGLSLFTMLKAVGVVTLLILPVLVSEFGFGNSMRWLFIAGGVGLFISAIVRAKYLESSPQQSQNREETILSKLMADTKSAARLVFTTFPAILIIAVLDAFSDSLFRFGALIYTNEWLGVSIEGISIMLIVQLLVSVPLLLKIGRMADFSLRKATIGVYSLMPISVTLLIVASVVPFWAPVEFISSVSNFIPIVQIIFSTPFLAIVLKYVSDALWALIFLTIVQKMMPREHTSIIIGVFWGIVYLCYSIAPLIGGLLFECFSPIAAFVTVMILNIGILVSITRNGTLIQAEHDRKAE